ncbi:MAG: branched-chain amino acid ABC transporter substrate-binding protein [Burkholderiaceae bacterium]|nr:branched-chain amino acid ABC transporter substrate-binding protein [Burkholderiaceae bacterium]
MTATSKKAFVAKKALLSTAAAAVILAGCSPKDSSVKIGHVAPMTGSIAHLGKDNEAGAKLAIADLNKADVKIDGKKVVFSLISEDDGADPKQGTAAAQKLVDAKVVGVVGHLNSGTTIPASKIYSDAGIPQISPSSTNPKYTQQGFKTAFRVVANDATLGGVLGKYAVNELKGKSIAVIDDRTAYGQGVADEFVKGVEAAGGKVVDRQFTTDKATDFMSILTAIRAKKPDILFYGGMDAVGGPMLRQMDQLKINAKFMGGDGVCTSEMIKLADKALGNNRVFCAEAGGVVGPYEKKMADFRERFKKEMGAEVNLYSPYVYDAVMVMVEAMKKANSTDPKKYLPELAKVQHDGITGPISFDDKGDIKGGTLTLFTYKDGKREALKVIQ